MPKLLILAAVICGGYVIYKSYSGKWLYIFSEWYLKARSRLRRTVKKFIKPSPQKTACLPIFLIDDWRNSSIERRRGKMK